MSSPPSADAAGGHGSGPAFSSRERWTLAGASLWLVIGLQLDAYAHTETPELESFWTPWHAVLYSGIAACGFTLLWLLRSRLPATPTYRTLFRDTPRPLRLPVIGMALLLVGGAIDTLWHNLFGIEQGLEILFSPSHFMLIIGMVLVACGPALMVADSPIRRLTGGASALVVLSTLLTALPVHIYTDHASALAGPLLGTGDNPMRTFSLDAQMMHGYVGSTVLLLLPILLIGRRWPLPVGVPTVLTAVSALALGVVMGSSENLWLAATVTGAAMLTEIVARLGLSAARHVPEDTRWMLLAVFAPVVVWGSVLLVGHVVSGVGWPIHMVTGLLTVVGLTGLSTAFLARRVVLDAPRTAAMR